METGEFFDTHPRAVKQWLDNLPIAHIGETSRQLYTAMHAVQRQDQVDVRHRFHFLEHVSIPLVMVLPELHKHYAGKPLPLTKKRAKIADLYTQLLRQAILGYEEVIARAIELNRLGWKKVVTTSVHRIFFFTGLLLLNQRQLYRPYKKGTWLHLYWLYQMVERYNLLQVKVVRLDMLSRKSSLQSEFYKVLLQSLLAPNLFRPRELDDVLNNMDIWIEELAITQKLPADNGQTYGFTLDADIPPGLVASNINVSVNPDVDARYLNLGLLLNYLNRLLDQAKPGVDEIQLTRHSLVSRRSLILLLNCWGRPTSRDGDRRLIQGQAEVAIGVSAIHYIVSDGAQPTSKSEQTPDKEPLVSTPDSTISLHREKEKSATSLAAMGFATDRDVQVDVWESVYYEPEPAPQSWTESIRLKVYSYLNAKVVNISKGGFCLALPHDNVENLQTGELVAIRGKQGDWQLGEICWLLCPDNAPIRAGIHKLSQSVVPALLHVQSSNHQSQPLKCLLGQNENGRILFLPNLPFSLHDKQLKLEVHNNRRSFQILEQMYATHVGSAYYFEWRKTPREQSEKDEVQISSGYESIWTKL